MSDTTNLADLPTDPHAGGGSENVVLQTSEVNSQYNPSVETSSAPSSQIDEQKIMNEFVSGIQQASASGATTLPSRDIPQNTVHFSDEEVKPNFVPQIEQQPDYIQNTDTEQDILARRMNNQNSRDSLEILYDEFQIPIIIGLLYFIFQLPVVRGKFLSLLPSLYNKDGNPNLTGYILNSLFFGVSYYVISKSLNHLQHV
ncbi:hypothetical protein N8261_03430 [Flavobacteriaceae bacterium]|nr:hypothetical protein [Flavobacteriaceae bacterium]